MYFTKHYVPKENDELLKKTVTPKIGNQYTLNYRKEWLLDRNRTWHVYSPSPSGGLCKACVLFDEKEQNRVIFVKTAFQDIKKSEKIKAHEKTQYHMDAMKAAQEYENPDCNIDWNKQKEKNHETNIHIMRRIVNAVLICAEQGMPLRGHRDHHKSESESCCERSTNRGNFLAILNAFARMDPILHEHLSMGKRNAKMVSWNIQNEIIVSIVQFIRTRIKDHVTVAQYFSLIADEVTDRHANKEVLLLCLRYVNFCNDEVMVLEIFLDSVHVQGRTTGKTIGDHIVDNLKKHGIDINMCRAQSYDGASAMSSKNVGASAFLKDIQPKADYTHCRSHCLNLSVAFACKNTSVRKCMDMLTSASHFFYLSGKRQQYFELIIDYYKDELLINPTQRTKIIGLARTRWVERHKAYDNFYLLHTCLVETFESIKNPVLYKKFYDHLLEKFNEEWTWDSETKALATGLYKSSRQFENLIAFSVLFNGLEPVKPLASKLQKRNQDIYTAYHMVDQVIDKLKSFRDNIDNEFKEWFDFAVSMGEKVGVNPSMPRLAPCWSRYRNNVENDGPLDYFKKSVAIPVINDLVNNLTERMKDRNLVELFAILPSVIVKEGDIDTRLLAKELHAKFTDDLIDNDIAFLNKLKRWKQHCKEKYSCRENKMSTKPISKSNDKRRVDPQKKSQRVDGKAAFAFIDPPDGFIETLKIADNDFFPNIRKLLILAATSPVGSSEDERAASGIRRLKTPYRSTMSDIREGNLNLIQLQRIVTEINIDEVIRIFKEMKPRRLFEYSVLFE